MKNIYIIIAVIIGLGLLVWVYVKYIGKGSYGISKPAQTQTQTVGQNTVTMKNLSFSPANLEVTPGTKVTWINEDTVDHTVTSNDNKLNSGLLARGSKFEFTFEQTGEYVYYCSIHPSMTAKIIVK